jgi:sialate O-acetylesterase
MHHKRLLPALLALCTAPAALLANITPAPLFKDGAVLQRDKPVPVWGTANAGEKVTVTFAGQTKSATADANGRWMVTLEPLPASATPGTLTFVGENTITLTDILVGEVWLASGQSNMEWSVNNTLDKAKDVPASANPLIRHVRIKKTVADSPASEVVIEKGRWESASPSTTGYFSAVGYYFAREIQAALGVPVGIINSSWGGTRAEAWTDPETFASTPALAYVAEEWAKALAEYPAKKAEYDAGLAEFEQRKAAAKAAGQPFPQSGYPVHAPWGPGHQTTPSGLYNGMIAPLVPYALRGTIWYQGEANAAKHAKYRELLSSMITGWRARFGQGDFPFYWVQLPNFAPGNQPDGNQWALFREAQTQILSLPATGQAVTIDVGDVRDIHPRNKKDVGNRLARLALARNYAIQIVDSGPVFLKAERENTGFRVSFTQLGGGLTTPLNELSGFELAGADKVFKPASAKIENDTVFVTSPEVPDPVAVRYAWRNAPAAGLFNKAGLPAAPFRTDAW